MEKQKVYIKELIKNEETQGIHKKSTKKNKTVMCIINKEIKIKQILQ